METSSSQHRKRDSDGIGCFGLFDTVEDKPSINKSSCVRRKQIKNKPKAKSKPAGCTSYPLFRPVVSQKRQKHDENDGRFGTSVNRENVVQPAPVMTLHEIEEKMKRQKQKEMRKQVSSLKNNGKPQTGVQSFFQSNADLNATSRTVSSSKIDKAEEIDSNHAHESTNQFIKASELSMGNHVPLNAEDQNETVTQLDEKMEEKNDSSLVTQQNHQPASSSSLPPMKNILSFLQHRSTNSNKRNTYFDGGYHGMRKHVHNQWNVCNSVELDASNCHRSIEVTTMQFDSEGILLAVGDTMGFVKIFDFDEVNPAAIIRGGEKDIGNNNDDTQPNAQTKLIRPFITFQAGDSRISCICWNPQNENLLVVTFS